MDKNEWELLRRLDRRTRFLTKELVDAKEKDARFEYYATQMEKVVMPTIEEFHAVLKFRRRVRHVILWAVSVALGAAITALINDGMQPYLIQDMRHSTQSSREASAGNK